MTGGPLAGLSDKRSSNPRSNKNSTRTPAFEFLELHQQHDFKLDAAADHDNHLTSVYCTVDGYFNRGVRIESPAGKSPDGIEMAALWQPEDGAVWCNPPYGRGLVAPFVNAWADAAAERGVKSVFFVPVRTEQDWWQTRVWNNARSAPYSWVKRIYFYPYRIHYLDHRGVVTVGAPFETCAVVFG